MRGCCRRRPVSPSSVTWPGHAGLGRPEGAELVGGAVQAAGGGDVGRVPRLLPGTGKSPSPFAFVVGAVAAMRQAIPGVHRRACDGRRTDVGAGPAEEVRRAGAVIAEGFRRACRALAAARLSHPALSCLSRPGSRRRAPPAVEMGRTVLMWALETHRARARTASPSLGGGQRSGVFTGDERRGKPVTDTTPKPRRLRASARGEGSGVRASARKPRTFPAVGQSARRSGLVQVLYGFHGDIHS
jgi:hypothetical protein